jgi:hypothetical protein
MGTSYAYLSLIPELSDVARLSTSCHNPVVYESILQMALVQSRCEEGVRHFSGNLGDELR